LSTAPDKDLSSHFIVQPRKIARNGTPYRHRHGNGDTRRNEGDVSGTGESISNQFTSLYDTIDYYENNKLQREREKHVQWKENACG